MTTMHTPNLGVLGIPNEPRRYGCGCQAHISHINHCPTHAQAPAMMALLAQWVQNSNALVPTTWYSDWMADVRATLHAAKSTK